MKRRLSPATLRRALLCLSLSLAFAAFPSFGWWFVMERDVAEAKTFDIVIPEGTAVRIARGEAPPTIPSTLNLRSNASLRIDNQDVIVHQIGAQIIPAGTERILPISDFLTTGSNSFVCSFHPGGAIGLQVGGGASPVSAVWATLLFAAPLTAVSFGVTTVLSRL